MVLCGALLSGIRTSLKAFKSTNLEDLRMKNFSRITLAIFAISLTIGIGLVLYSLAHRIDRSFVYLTGDSISYANYEEVTSIPHLKGQNAIGFFRVSLDAHARYFWKPLAEHVAVISATLEDPQAPFMIGVTRQRTGPMQLWSITIKQMPGVEQDVTFMFRKGKEQPLSPGFYKVDLEDYWDHSKGGSPAMLLHFDPAASGSGFEYALLGGNTKPGP